MCGVLPVGTGLWRVRIYFLPLSFCWFWHRKRNTCEDAGECQGGARSVEGPGPASASWKCSTIVDGTVDGGLSVVLSGDLGWQLFCFSSFMWKKAAPASLHSARVSLLPWHLSPHRGYLCIKAHGRVWSKLWGIHRLKIARPYPLEAFSWYAWGEDVL